MSINETDIYLLGIRADYLQISTSIERIENLIETFESKKSDTMYAEMFVSIELRKKLFEEFNKAHAPVKISLFKTREIQSLKEFERVVSRPEFSEWNDKRKEMEAKISDFKNGRAPVPLIDEHQEALDKLINMLKDDKESLKELSSKPDFNLSIDFLPKKYDNIEFAEELYTIFTDGRAENLKEAINILETDNFRQNYLDELNEQTEIEYMRLEKEREVAKRAKQQSAKQDLVNTVLINNMHKQKKDIEKQQNRK